MNGPRDYEYRTTSLRPTRDADGYCPPDPQQQIVEVGNFGSDETDRWRTIPRTFGARFAYIGPRSEWDSCAIGVGGDFYPVSVGAPLVLPPGDHDLIVRPHRQLGDVVTNHDSIQGKLQLIVLNYVPEWAPVSRPPRVYPMVESVALDSATETLLFLKTEWLNGVVKPINQYLIVAGAKSFSLYLRNAEASDITWRLAGVRQNGQEYPVSDPLATTFKTIAAGTNEAWHFDVEENAFEAMVLYAKSTAAGTITLFHEAEVRDGF